MVPCVVSMNRLQIERDREGPLLVRLFRVPIEGEDMGPGLVSSALIGPQWPENASSEQLMRWIFLHGVQWPHSQSGITTSFLRRIEPQQAIRRGGVARLFGAPEQADAMPFDAIGCRECGNDSIGPNE